MAVDAKEDARILRNESYSAWDPLENVGFEIIHWIVYSLFAKLNRCFEWLSFINIEIDFTILNESSDYPAKSQRS